jgi:hypothetical protein
MGNPFQDARSGELNPNKPCHSERPYREESASGGAQQHATILPSASHYKDADESAHAEAEDRKLRKDP